MGFNPQQPDGCIKPDPTHLCCLSKPATGWQSSFQTTSMGGAGGAVRRQSMVAVNVETRGPRRPISTEYLDDHCEVSIPRGLLSTSPH